MPDRSHEYAMLQNPGLDYPEQAAKILVYDRIYLIEQMRLLDPFQPRANTDYRRKIKNAIERRYYLLWQYPPNNVKANVWLRRIIEQVNIIFSNLKPEMQQSEVLEKRVLDLLKTDPFNLLE